MLHARIPDFSQPVPVRRPIAAAVIVAPAVAPQARAVPSVLACAALLGGELLAALAIIGGGILFTGLATLL